MSDTIAAISTAPGNSGISIIRISGDDAVTVADRIFRMKGGKKLQDCESHTIHYGYICDGNSTVDEVLVTLMKKPRSYTTEDTVEINCHGGSYVVQRVLQLACQAGARPAEAGEFTKRAFLAGRIDLSQAEAVMDLIQSGNEYALQASVRQLKGDVSERIRQLRSEILYQMAYLESALDDPEHFTLDGYRESLAVSLDEWKKEIERLISSYDNGRRIMDGIRTSIIGKPNAGKSSLLNLLDGEERAIVTEIPGTTRDVLQDTVRLDDLTLLLNDTAGIRKTDDKVEKLGVERALRSVEESDLVLYMADLSCGMDENDQQILDAVKDKSVIVIFNKMDLFENKNELTDRVNEMTSFLPEQLKKESPILFSTKTHAGYKEMKDRIHKMFFTGDINLNDQVIITNVRHKDLLASALNSLKMVSESMEKELPEDFYTSDLTDAYRDLGLIIGEEVEDDLVDEIFADFCVGK